MNLRKTTICLLAAFIAQIIWGVAGPLVKIVLVDVPPFSLLFFRSLFTCLILFPLFEFKLLPTQAKMNWQDKKDMFLTGFFGVFLNIAFYFVGQELTSVTDAWVITSAGVIFIVLYSYFYLHERLKKVVYLGIVLAFVGTLVVIGTPILSFGSGNFFGNVLMLGSTVAAIVSTIINKRLVEKFSSMIIVYYSFLISLIFTLPFFLLEFVKNPYWLGSLTLMDLSIIGYLILGSSIGAYYLSNLSLTGLSASLASTMTYVSTIIAVGLAIIFLHEKITPYFLIGSGLIVVGIILAETRHRRQKSA